MPTLEGWQVERRNREQRSCEKPRAGVSEEGRAWSSEKQSVWDGPRIALGSQNVWILSILDHHLLAVWPQATYLTSLKLRPLLSKLSVLCILKISSMIFKMKGLPCVECFHSFTLWCNTDLLSLYNWPLGELWWKEEVAMLLYSQQPTEETPFTLGVIETSWWKEEGCRYFGQAVLMLWN